MQEDHCITSLIVISVITIVAMIIMITSTTIALLSVILITLVSTSTGKKAYQKSPKETGGKIFVA